MKALGYLELDYVGRFLFSLEASLSTPTHPSNIVLLFAQICYVLKSFHYKFVLKLIEFCQFSNFQTSFLIWPHFWKNAFQFKQERIAFQVGETFRTVGF